MLLRYAKQINEKCGIQQDRMMGEIMAPKQELIQDLFKFILARLSDKRGRFQYIFFMLQPLE